MRKITQLFTYFCAIIRLKTYKYVYYKYNMKKDVASCNKLATIDQKKTLKNLRRKKIWKYVKVVKVLIFTFITSRDNNTQ